MQAHRAGIILLEMHMTEHQIGTVHQEVTSGSHCSIHMSMDYRGARQARCVVCFAAQALTDPSSTYPWPGVGRETGKDLSDGPGVFRGLISAVRSKQGEHIIEWNE